ncbi:MAG: phosphoribosylaminoimidazolesuccinocarboxamide synthase [SAR202 cluster bacterium]|nr:phosphoribosylaminoimidazolesuccinocarboxamide synthase [SAR202 cluster bacterium]
MTTIMESPLPDLIYRGKVRDTHEMGDGLLLMVATDRISAFDVVMPNGIPDKGAVLCQLSSYWFAQTAGIVPNHLVALAGDRDDVSAPPEIVRQAMVVRRAERIDVECVIRGYITGSAWAEYKKSGTVQDLPMPTGLQEGDRFPEPLFTPTTKAEVGHDENMSKQEVEDMVGVDTAKLLEATTAKVYMAAHEIALEKGIIIADTKMEFGFIDGELTLIDELLTPDSSRFWDASGYAPGKSQPNFDKQFVRDWLNSQGWDHEPPAPALPDDVVSKTRERYLEAHTRLTGNSLS